MLGTRVGGDMVDADERWPALAEAIAKQRVDLGLSQAELALRAGVSLTTVQNYESVKRRRTGKRRPLAAAPKIEKALDWAPGEMNRILAADAASDAAPAARPGSASEDRMPGCYWMSPYRKKRLRQRIIEDGALMHATKLEFIAWLDSLPEDGPPGEGE